MPCSFLEAWHIKRTMSRLVWLALEMFQAAQRLELGWSLYQSFENSVKDALIAPTRVKFGLV